MNKLLKFRGTFWLRIILVLCGILVNGYVLIKYRNVDSDFAQDYIAAVSLRQGTPLYGENINQLANKILRFRGIPNFHPPFNAILFLPFSFIGYQNAYVALGILSIVLLLIINLCIAKGLDFNNEWFLNITCFTLFWYPVFYCLGTGQSSMIIATCIIGGWLCLRHDKAYASGFLFAFATLIKLFPGLVLFYLLLLKNWRVLFATILFIAIGLLFTFFFVGYNDIRTYTLIMIARDIGEWQGFVLNHSIDGMATRLFGRPTAWTNPIVNLSPYLSVMSVLFNSSLLIYSIQKMHKMVLRNCDDYAFGLTIVTMLLLSPITWGHIFPVLIFPIALLLKEYINGSSSYKLRSVLLVLFCLSLPDVFIARKLMAIHYPFRMPWYNMLLTLIPGAGLILLWLIMCRRANV